MNWKVEFDKKAADELLRLDKVAKNRIINFIDDKILKGNNPKEIGAPLKGNLSGLWKYRVGEYRLICKIEHNNFTVLVVNLGHRKKIYKT